MHNRLALPSILHEPNCVRLELLIQAVPDSGLLDMEISVIRDSLFYQ